MSGGIVIRTTDLSKAYRLADKPWHRLLEGLGLARDRESQTVLYPTSLEIVRGQSVGIVGRNGSGKSTLLSLIAGILTPTTGSVERVGRVSALLELGCGFNPEFTGRENVFFSGALMGLSVDDMLGRFDDIASFAEIGDYIDRPVKTYSSGMFVRLAFATAISVDPDVLIVDEALSVGDIYFQQKCFERLRDLRSAGVTLLFVSHDSSAITRFCDRALYMESGRVVLDEAPSAVIHAYESSLIKQRDADAARHTPITASPVGDASIEKAPIIAGELPIDPITSREILHPDIKIERFELVDQDGHSLTVVTSEDAVTVRTSIRFFASYQDPHCGFKIRNRFGEVIFETNTYCVKTTVGPVRAGETIEVDFDFALPLIEGEYTLSLGVADGGYGDGLFRKQLAYTNERFGFRILRNGASIQWAGVVNLFPECTIRRSNSVEQTVT